MKKVLTNLFIVLMVLAALWVLVSFIDINLHNSPFSENTGNFLPWNIFVLFFT